MNFSLRQNDEAQLQELGFYIDGGEGGIIRRFTPHPSGCRRRLRRCLASLGSNREGSHPPMNFSLRQNDEAQLQELGFYIDGGEGGIRTLDTLRYTHFPGVLLRPLGHLTSCLIRISEAAYFNGI